MISDLSTYSLTDFLMFTPDMYFRLYELLNAGLWPAPLLAAPVGLLLLGLARRGGPAAARMSSGLAAAAWAAVAWWFFHRLYTDINLAASWFAVGFGIQSALLTLFGVVVGRLGCARPSGITGRLGMAVLVFALLVHPLLGPLAGRSWTGVELFGLAPDPTALGTLGLLLTSPWRHRWVLALLPLGWCVVSALTYLAMDAPHGLVTPVLGVIAALAMPWRR